MARAYFSALYCWQTLISFEHAASIRKEWFAIFLHPFLPNRETSTSPNYDLETMLKPLTALARRADTRQCLALRLEKTNGPQVHLMKILAISGSLRKASLNTMLLRAKARLAPPDVAVVLFPDLGDTPLFNPNIETSEPPVVTNFRAQLLAADAVLIASPEYAHGVAGVMKNALDWMVGCEAFVNKPVALLNASPRAIHAYAALKETIAVMSAIVIEEASISVPLLGSGLDEASLMSDPKISGMLIAALEALRCAILLRAENT